MIDGIVLAAGEGRRFGSNKLLYPVDGRPMIGHALATALASRLDRIHVVLGHDAARVEAALADAGMLRDRLTIIYNSNYHRGLMSSLKCGLQAVSPGAAGAMVMLGDMPYVLGQGIERVIAAFERRPGFVVATVGGKPTHPRVIPRACFEQFMSLPDDAKGQDLIEAAGFEAVEVPDSSGRDIDRPEDVA